MGSLALLLAVAAGIAIGSLIARPLRRMARHRGTTMVLRRLDEMDRLVADMLTLASAEAGPLVQPQPIELTDFFEDLRRDLPLFGERRFHLEPVGGVLEADPDRLTQVLRNLVRNAHAHTDPDDRIDVAAQAHDRRLVITVSDRGLGIDAEHLEHIVERFYRAEDSRSRDRAAAASDSQSRGTIVEAHGGRIWAQSGVGKDTSMHLELPGYRPPAR